MQNENVPSIIRASDFRDKVEYTWTLLLMRRIADFSTVVSLLSSSQRHCGCSTIRNSSKTVWQPIHAWLSLVADQSSLPTDGREMARAAGAFCTMNYDVRDEESRYFAQPRDALKIAMQPMLFSTRAAIALRRRAILRSSHDPDCDGEFARLLEQLLTTGCRSRGDARALARAFWRLGSSGPYRVAGVLRTLASGAIRTENSHVGRSKSRTKNSHVSTNSQCRCTRTSWKIEG